MKNRIDWTDVTTLLDIMRSREVHYNPNTQQYRHRLRQEQFNGTVIGEWYDGAGEQRSDD